MSDNIWPLANAIARFLKARIDSKLITKYQIYDAALDADLRDFVDENINEWLNENVEAPPI